MVPIQVWGGHCSQDPMSLSQVGALRRSPRQVASGGFGGRNGGNQFLSLLECGGFGGRLENPKGERQRTLPLQVCQSRGRPHSAATSPQAAAASRHLPATQPLFSCSVQTPWGHSGLGGAAGGREFEGGKATSKKYQRFHNFTKLSQTAFCSNPPALSWTPNLHKSWEVITKS